MIETFFEKLLTSFGRFCDKNDLYVKYLSLFIFIDIVIFYCIYLFVPLNIFFIILVGSFTICTIWSLIKYSGYDNNTTFYLLNPLGF